MDLLPYIYHGRRKHISRHIVHKSNTAIYRNWRLYATLIFYSNKTWQRYDNESEKRADGFKWIEINVIITIWLMQCIVDLWGTCSIDEVDEHGLLTELWQQATDFPCRDWENVAQRKFSMNSAWGKYLFVSLKSWTLLEENMFVFFLIWRTESLRS